VWKQGLGFQGVVEAESEEAAKAVEPQPLTQTHQTPDAGTPDAGTPDAGTPGAGTRCAGLPAAHGTADGEQPPSEALRGQAHRVALPATVERLAPAHGTPATARVRGPQRGRHRCRGHAVAQEVPSRQRAGSPCLPVFRCPLASFTGIASGGLGSFWAWALAVGCACREVL